jgi:PTS system cellobiose-specific IIC component
MNAIVAPISLQYLLIQRGVVHKLFVNVPRTTPPIIGHYLVSGGDWRAAVWGALSIVIAMSAYYPIAKAAERQRLKGQAEGADTE